jgi:GIY-YIG catalytic domain-containing protein
VTTDAHRSERPQSQLPSPDPRLLDWAAWLALSGTPDVASLAEAMRKLTVRGGTLTDSDAWPTESGPRIYVAFDDQGAVYVGQTTRLLETRIRGHFARQRSAAQQRKAGTWEFVVSAAFRELRHGDLDRLERSAAEWLLPLRHRKGRRHPRGLRRPRHRRDASGYDETSMPEPR